MPHLLITGGTGSFGTAMLARLAHKTEEKSQWQITVLSRDEKKQDDLKAVFPNVRFVIGDTRDMQSVAQAMRGVEYVFHAAALKQVPNCESHPLEAIKTNILGTENVLRAAGEYGVKRVITLSTDKACYPINAMGQTKALAEKLTLNYNHRYPNTDFVCTRYGNVLRSRGSVVPLWEQLERDGRPLLLTNPRMTRFLMTLDEAVDLVFLAFKDSDRECIYVLKSPAAFMEDVAEAISHNVIIGRIRPGEKLDEVLVTSEEARRCLDMGTYFKITNKHQHAVHQQFCSANARLLSVDEIRAILYPEVKKNGQEGLSIQPA
jgi:UDP-N-acetylglucosamine 4,6-dehydratase/5-epimerase